ncbi:MULTISPECIES: ATP-binding protein [Brevibacillus]|uniref:ATP-binding protein n=1 Tax=Brevibacillus TaxID=55080 RepID=UPI000D0FCE4B|nr:MULTISPECIES: ATP-binding protein [Brevibacillus]MED1947213.1 ATP-binding protein [Brevibacillus formosus]MED1997520.1 ATP-binding protein [Brevibacillus formosus]MED2083377.1 ATP-binding protein [Brevibacillus formosus]PSK16805.1 hypothetical protein C7R94_15925 [Brevibacillus sp. NRRL NRS-603]
MKFDLDFIAKLYNNRNSYADVFSNDELEALHVESGIEPLLRKYIEQKKQIFLTGNPGDGKTHLIKSLRDILEHHEAFIEPDANSIKDEEEFLGKLESAIKAGKPCIIAINEFPLLSILESLGERLPGFHQISAQREKGIIYNKSAEYPIREVVVIDLNNRNLLSINMAQRTLEKLLEISRACGNCSCPSKQNLVKLKHPIVQERLLALIEKIGSIGMHVVMRDLLGFFAYVITGGKKCIVKEKEEYNDNQYFNLVFSGFNQLFSSLSVFDPYHYTHPEIDESLWNGTLREGWLFENQYEAPENTDDPIEAFKALKRKFYFENERGGELLDLLPVEYKAYYEVLKDGYDRDYEMIRRIISGINKFFNPDDHEDDKLKIWTTHKYELRTYPKVAVSSKYAYSNQIELLVPKLPSYLKDMEYVPDHFLLRIFKNKDNSRYVELRIDLSLYRVLTLVQSGYPSQLVPEQHQFKLLRFMKELSSLDANVRSNDFIIRDMDNRSSYKVKVNDAQFISKRG